MAMAFFKISFSESRRGSSTGPRPGYGEAQPSPGRSAGRTNSSAMRATEDAARRRLRPPDPGRTMKRPLFEVQHHMLDPRVVLEPVHRQVLAVAGFLEAAVGHLGDDRDVVVDPDAAEVERVGDPPRAADVAGPD